MPVDAANSLPTDRRSGNLILDSGFVPTGLVPSSDSELRVDRSVDRLAVDEHAEHSRLGLLDAAVSKNPVPGNARADHALRDDQFLHDESSADAIDVVDDEIDVEPLVTHRTNVSSWAGDAGLLEELPDYWKESSRPLVSLVFVGPMLFAYEVGMLALGPSAVRNGAEVWLRQLLDAVGLGQYFLLPLLTCVGLLMWHGVSCARWQFRPSVFFGMTIESATLAMGLLVLAQLQGSWCGLQASMHDGRSLPEEGAVSFVGGLLGYLGAGIYEELLFRLALLPLAAVLLRGCGISRKSAWFLAMVVVSVVFSLAHYQWDFQIAGIHLRTSGYAFDWFSFSFRFLAGTLFSLLFVVRGFGIAVGTHAMYDLFAVLL